MVAGCGDSGAPLASRLTRKPALAPTVAASAVLAHAESLYLASEYDSVLALLQPALADSRQRSDPVAETRILTRLGLTANQQGDSPAARRYLDEALRVAAEQRLSGDLLEAHNALGLVSRRDDHYIEARGHFEEAVRIAQAIRDPMGFTKASGNLGLALASLGELPEARERLVAMRDSGRALGQPRYEANAMANIAMLDIWEGQATAAIPVLDSARALYRTIAFIPGEQNALGQLATAFEQIGEYAQAFAAFDSSLSLARATGMKDDEAEILGLIASLHARLGDYRAAMRTYDEMVGAASRLGLVGELGTVKRNTAAIHLQLGDVGRAHAGAQEALRIHRNAGALFDELDDLLVLAEVADRLRHPRERTALLTEARTIADSLGTRSGRMAVALTGARLADRADDPERVLAALRDVDSTAFPADFAALAEMHALAARAFARRGMLDSAAAMGNRAIASVERVRADLTSEPLRRALLADRSGVYAEQVITLLRLHRVGDAFSVADGARSRGLVDFLASARKDLPGRPTAGGFDEGERLLRQIEVLLARLKSIDSVPARERSPGAVTMSADLMARLEKARGDYESLLARAVRDEPAAAALLGVRRPSLDQVQRALEPGEALLEYLVAPDRIVIFVATRDGLRSFQVPGAAGTLTDRVGLLRELWGANDSDWHQGLPAARALDSVLLQPLLRSGTLKGVRRLVVVPHGVLGQLPFAALVDVQTGRFVAQDFEVSYLPSGGTLPALRRSGNAGGVSLGGVAFAPFPRELPASAGEVAAVQRVVPGLSTAVGKSATEEAVRNALGSPGIVHVASHGTLNSRNPMFARVELAPVSRGSSANDGRLEVHELLDTSVRSHLVFLSGCETSVAQSWIDDAVRGTDYTTLAQALLYAGAANVVGTLWRVDDSGASLFAETFYAPLMKSGLTTALASAQRTMIASPKFAHPYYWAGYILTGGGRFGY